MLRGRRGKTIVTDTAARCGHFTHASLSTSSLPIAWMRNEGLDLAANGDVEFGINVTGAARAELNFGS